MDLPLKRTKQFDSLSHTKKRLSLSGHLKYFNLKALKTLKPSCNQKVSGYMFSTKILLLGVTESKLRRRLSQGEIVESSY